VIEKTLSELARELRGAGVPRRLAPASGRLVSLSPRRLAAVLARLIGAGAFAAGWALEGDPGSGVVRGGFEVAAVLVCFAGIQRALLPTGGE
jgi:hypothetical protein